MSVLIEKAQTALVQAEEMNNAAKEDKWDLVQELQSEHGELVSQLAIAEVPSELATKLRDILIQVRTLNRETESLADETKKHLVQEKKTLEKANKMQKALDAFK
ncbi:flagellar protein FliT [Neptuniibacter sp. QD72_48]|uniref:flagellar protein FliT n=1 Tax=unclassified Neptuniibacter TaxID=2630693 RepID=UPI0039F6372C